MKDYEEFLSETIENATDNIITQLNKAYMYGHEQGKKSSCDCKDNMESEYNRGLNEAWEMARELVNMPDKDIEECFNVVALNTNGFRGILHHTSASEVMAKIKEYEQQRQDDWYDIPSDEMTLEQARRAVKELREKVACNEL